MTTRVPGEQPDPLNWIQQGKYYGHPNPTRQEYIFGAGYTPADGVGPQELAQGRRKVRPPARVGHDARRREAARSGEVEDALLALGDELLLGAVRADDADDAARRQLERQPVDQEPVAIALIDALG